MFICNNCGETFDDPIVKSGLVGEYLGTPAYEDYGYCPYCGSDNWNEKGIEDEDL